MKRKNCAAAVCLLAMAGGRAGYSQTAGQGLERFRETYKELVETNTTLSSGDCTLAATRMAARLKAAGYREEDVRVFVPDGHPREGGLLAVLRGSDPNAKAILMLAHVDVVEAKREDWTRDPFTLVEEGGYFYARGASDDKAQAAIWVDNLVRYREEGFRPKRSIKLALTRGEETNSALNGAGWLAQNEREAIDAEFALNEGAGGALDAQGRRVALEILAAEKTSQNFLLEATNPGGHSSRPVPDNAIYHITRAVDQVSEYEFPVQLNDANRAYFTGMSKIVGGEAGTAMAAVLRNPGDAASVAAPIKKLADEMWPGIPIVPVLEPGATDAQFLNPAGIPTYGISGIFEDPDLGHIHGLNERIRANSVYEGRTFLYRLVKLYAEE